MASEASADELHLLYLDWCSSQVARRFLELSHDEIWFRSHAVSPPRSESSESDPSLHAIDRIPGYLELVRRTALALAQEMNLPPFEEWKELYLRNPEAFRMEILGS